MNDSNINTTSDIVRWLLDRSELSSVEFAIKSQITTIYLMRLLQGEVSLLSMPLNSILRLSVVAGVDVVELFSKLRDYLIILIDNDKCVESINFVKSPCFRDYKIIFGT